MKYHEAIIKQFDGCMLVNDENSAYSAVAYINLAMTITDLKPEHARLVRDKIKETLEWLEPFATDSSRVNDCITAAQAWLKATKTNNKTAESA